MAKKKKAKTKTVQRKSKVIAQWYTKQFYIGTRDLNAFVDFSLSASMDTDTKAQKKKMPKLVNVAPKNGQISFTIPLNRAWCSDVKKEATWWVNEVNKGTVSLFYIGKKAVSKNQWKIVSADISEVRLVPEKKDTVFDKCRVNVTFQEQPTNKKQNKKTVKTINKKLKKSNKNVSAKLGQQSRKRKEKVKVK